MASRSFFAFTLILCSAGTLLLPSTAYAETLLSRATVQNLRNQVDLFLKQRSPRPARKADIMSPGDALQTYRTAMAELRFNDNSLVRVGEQAVFQFRPDTRTVDLKKGTILLLIPPGKGRTRVHTPNAAAGIRGSALFVRYIPDSGVSIVGALTNSDIEISNSDGSQTYVLKAGQLAYVYQDRIGIYNFDLKEFHNTSPFMKDLDLNELSAVKEEMEQALAVQSPFAGKVEETPLWTKLSSNRGDGQLLSNQEKNLDPRSSSPARSVPSLLDNPRELLIPKQPGESPNIPPSVATPGIPLPPPERPIPTPPPERPIPTPIESPIAAPPTRPTPTPPEPTPATPPTVNQLPSPTNPPTRPAPAPLQSTQVITPQTTPPTTPATPPTAPLVNPAPTPVLTTPPVTAPSTPAAPQTPAVTPTLDLPSVQPAPTAPTRPTPAPNSNASTGTRAGSSPRTGVNVNIGVQTP